MQMSIIKATIKALRIVPIPGFWFKGIQKIKTETLIINVINPTENPDFEEIPWANTLHGDAPEAETINKPSPKPNKVSPKQRKKNVDIFGLKLSGLSELQGTTGIFFIFKNIIHKLLLLNLKSIKVVV